MTTATATRQMVREPDGRECLPAALDRLWPVFLRVFGSARCERARLAVRFGLQETTKGQARDAWRKRMIPRVRELGLTVPAE